MSRFTAISNLYPWPGQPGRGLYNRYLFREMARALGDSTQGPRLQTLCLVPAWRFWRWPDIRKWAFPDASPRDPAASSVPVRYLPVPYVPWIGRSLGDRLYSLALRGWRATVQAGDIIYVSWLYPDAAAVSRAVRKRGARLWLMVLGSDTFHLRSALRRRSILAACAAAEGIVCVSNSLASRIVGAGAAEGKVHVVPNGVDTALFRPRDRGMLPAALPLSDAVDGRLRELLGRRLEPSGDAGPLAGRGPAAFLPRLILFVGNLVSVKGPDLLLDAYSQLVSPAGSTPACCAESALLIIGDGPMRGQLERLACERGIASQVHFLGRRPPSEVALWMNAADCLCLPSRSEGMPNVVLEARASGLPVVTTPAGACPELSLQGEHFLVTEACSPQSVAQGLREMLQRDVGRRDADKAVPTWREQAGRILHLINACERADHE